MPSHEWTTAFFRSRRSVDIRSDRYTAALIAPDHRAVCVLRSRHGWISLRSLDEVLHGTTQAAAVPGTNPPHYWACTSITACSWRPSVKEVVVDRRHMLASLTFVGLSLLVGSQGAQATAVRFTAGNRDPRDHDEDCERVTTTGHATVRRRCDGSRTEASVDNRVTVTDPRAPRKTYERPVDRLRARGEGRIHATGDKGARRELHEKGRRGS